MTLGFEFISMQRNRRRRIAIAAGLFVLCAHGLATVATNAAEVSEPAYRQQAIPLLRKYCTDCHGAQKQKGEINFETYSTEASVAKDRKFWEKVVEVLRNEEMPPEGKPHPTPQEYQTLIGPIEAILSKMDCTGPQDPGRVTIHRLNRAEYNNTIRDLVGLDFHPADDFPQDDLGYGFDNIGDVLSIPPLLLEKYLAAAERIASDAIFTGERETGPRKKITGDQLQAKNASNYGNKMKIMASTGEVFAEFEARRTGPYILRVRAFAQQAGNEPAKMAFRMGDKELQVVEVPAEENDPGIYEVHLGLEKGKARLAAAFVNDFYDPDNPDPNRRDRNLIVDYLELQGPMETKALPPSHERILFRTPKADGSDREEVLRDVLGKFASRAFRRPVTDDELNRLVALTSAVMQDGESYEAAVQIGLEAVLVSPQFLFRIETDKGPPTPGGYPLNDWELATRLSYFLWSSMPDDELFDLARQGKLHEPAVIDAHVRRMLADAKAKAFVENFAGQWLQLRNLKIVTPDSKLFPKFGDGLREAMRKETELFFEAVLKEDLSILTFLDADFTFVNDRLARHYDMPDIQGKEFRRITLGGDKRGGVLTQASVLTITSNPTRTSPVKRGKWVLENILGTPPPPPPPGVEELSEDKDKVLSGTLRQRMEQHRSNPSCASCHQRMDPLGFGFENFDAIGAWRTRDGEFDIDPSGTLPNGKSFQTPKELRAILLERQGEFRKCLAEKLLTYALGRGIESYDACAIDRIVKETAEHSDKFQSMILAIVHSDPFQKRRSQTGAP